MEFQEIFKILNASKVIKEFSNIQISAFKQLIRGYDSNGKTADFTEAQKVELTNTIEKVAFKLLDFVKNQREKKMQEFSKKSDE